MKLAKKILVGAVSGIVVFNCYSAANAVRSKKQDVSLTVTHPGASERNIVIFDACSLINQFKRVLDMAEKTVLCVQNDCIHSAEYGAIPRRKIHRIFNQIYKNIFWPVLESSFENYGSKVRTLECKDFVPKFLIYTDKTEHKCDVEKFHDFSIAIKRKMKKNGVICRAMEEYLQASPEFLSDAQKILDNSIKKLQKLCAISKGLPTDDPSSSSESDEPSDCDLFNFFDTPEQSSGDELGDELVVHPEVDGADQGNQPKDDVFKEPDSCPSPAPESGNCFTNFFSSIGSIFSRK